MGERVGSRFMKTDTQSRYGTISRMLHWTMAALFLWQFTGMLLKVTVGRVPLTGFFLGTHGSIGIILFLLAVIRILWALSHRGQRPQYASGLLGSTAHAGHFLLYTLMAVVPTLAILRMIGSGKPIAFFGMPISAGSGYEVQWMMAPANAAHGLLAWILFVLILGHIAMALIHHFFLKDDNWGRILGTPLSERS